MQKIEKKNILSVNIKENIKIVIKEKYNKLCYKTGFNYKLFNKGSGKIIDGFSNDKIRKINLNKITYIYLINW